MSGISCPQADAVETVSYARDTARCQTYFFLPGRFTERQQVNPEFRRTAKAGTVMIIAVPGAGCIIVLLNNVLRVREIAVRVRDTPLNPRAGAGKNFPVGIDGGGPPLVGSIIIRRLRRGGEIVDGYSRA